MGNCCGSESHEPESYQLKSNKKTAGNGQSLGGNASSGAGDEGSREAMLIAAEKRRVQAENRGVKEGGKLSKQLAEQKKQPHQPSPSKNDLDDKLVWD